MSPARLCRRQEPTPREHEAASWFARGISLEEDPNTHAEAIAAYLRVLDLEPAHAAAHINLGTLYYNRQEFGLAESTTGKRSKRIRVTHSPISIWAMFSMKPDASTKP